MLYWLFFGASALVGIYTDRGRHAVPEGTHLGPAYRQVGHLAVVNLIWIALGCIIDWIGILLLTAHLCAVLAALGLDPILIGVIFCITCRSRTFRRVRPGRVLFQEPRRPIISIADIFKSVCRTWASSLSRS